MVFLITFAAVLEETALTSTTPLKTLAGLTREMVRDAVLDAIANPVDLQPSGGRPRKNTPAAEKLVVALEEPLHFHVALKLTALQRFLPFKQALRDRHGLASHWSTTHTLFWSTTRYLVFGNEEKQVDKVADMVQWTHDGRTMNLYEESQEPDNSKVLKARREKKEIEAAAQPQTKKPRFSKPDFTALVLAEGLKTPNAVMRYVKAKGSEGARSFVQRHEEQLPRLLRFAKKWDNAEDNAALEEETEWQTIQRISQKSCSCTGGKCQWEVAAEAFFARQKATIDEELLAAVLAKVIQQGPGKCARVPMIAGVTNAGKSTVLDPVDPVFGYEHVLHTPAENSTMPLANLVVSEDAQRFIYFDEFAPVTFASTPDRRPTVPATTFKKLFGGQRMEVQTSQSFNNGNGVVRWRQGAAMTAPLEGLWDLKGKVTQEDVRHMKSRVWQFDALEALPQEVLRDIPHCAGPWCRWLMRASAAYAARSVPQPLAVPPPAPQHMAGDSDHEIDWNEVDWDEL